MGKQAWGHIKSESYRLSKRETGVTDFQGGKRIHSTGEAGKAFF